MSTTADRGARTSAEARYSTLTRGGSEQAASEQLLRRRHWIHELAEFDAHSGEMLASPLSEVCARLDHRLPEGPGVCKDRIYRILEHARDPLREILAHLHEGLVREHAFLPIQAVREMDTASFFALSRRPGRTVREKLSDKPSLWAVRRRWTVDTAENRLVKAFCARLSDLARMRAGARTEPEDSWLGDLLATIESWLHGPAAVEIGRWHNLPPNNVLLQHRDYRRVWDAWLWTETLDDDMQRDFDQRLEQWTSMVFWSMAAQLARSAGVRVLEQPCHLDYERFEIKLGRKDGRAEASIAGLICARPSRTSFGIVSRLGVDKNDESYAFVELAGGESAFCHSRSFQMAQDFDRVRVGTALAFELGREPDGKLRAVRPTILSNPQPFRVELLESLRLAVCPPIGDRIEMICAEDGDQVLVRIGARTVAAEMSPMGAAFVAKSALAQTIGVHRETLTPDLRAPARSTSHAGTACIVDLCTLRPRFAAGNDHGHLPFRLLWQKWLTPGQDPVGLDVGDAKAIALGKDIASVSILDLLAAEPTHSAALLSEAARSFAARLHAELPGESLTYIVPDATDEFSLGIMRRSVNAAFRCAEPLPRSIAAVFDCQSSGVFAANNICHGDCVLVLDTVGGTLSATPLLARKKKELALRLPESAGIYWERCPSVVSCGQTTSTETAIRVFKKFDCSFPDELARLCGFQGLVDEGLEVSWQNEDGAWHTAPHHHERVIHDALLDLQNPWEELAGGLRPELARLPRGARVFVLLAGDVFQGPKPRAYNADVLWAGDVVHFRHALEPVRGANVLHRWQERAGDMPLWYDHLPELSMRINRDGRFARFHLVKDVTVSPRRGKVNVIAIDETFVLPAGQPDYQFPLLQGSEGNELHYEAFLRSPVFPLQQDLPVALHLTYTYGRDTPYELIFAPHSPALGGMAPVRAEWRTRAGGELPSLFPTLPDAEPWARFVRYPRRDSEATNDLLDWIRDGLQRLGTSSGAMQAQRQVGIVPADIKLNAKGRPYFQAKSGRTGVFCQEAEFIDPEAAGRIRPGDAVTFEVEEGPRGLRARWIALGDNTEQIVDDRMLGLKAFRMRERATQLRFPFRTVWSDGHSLVEPDAPEAFRDTIRAGSETLVALLRQQPSADWSTERANAVLQLSDEALFLLCCMHQDAPAEVATKLQAAFVDEGGPLKKIRDYRTHIALSLGAGQLGWQQGLLGSVLELVRREPPDFDAWSVGLRILGIALWRCGSLLEELSQTDVLAIVDRVSRVLADDLRRMSRRPDEMPREAREALKDHLELVLALLRTRGSKNTEIRGILAPGKEIAKALAQTVERIVNIVSDHGIPIRSRIKLTVNKPKALHWTPDLLYALKLYLTGDDGARAIQVLAVQEDDD